MNRFDDAVLDLLSSTPRATTVDGLRARVRRRRRRRAIKIVAITTVISVGSVGVAASLGHDTHGSRVAISPTTPSTASTDRQWCVKFSRNAAIVRAVAYGTVILAEPSARAKLVSLAELLRGKDNPFATSDPQVHLTDHDEFWVVDLRPTGKSQGPYKWGLVALDANTGDVVTANEGPSTGPGGVVTEPATEPPYWNALPDHGSECPSGTAATTTSSAGGSASLLAACTAGARAYDGVVIAAFKDPSSRGQVICWADGHVAKSPPPLPGHSQPKDYDRVVFTATLDGKNRVLVEAGYRTSLPVQAPAG
jgi:hypothetical protein